MTLQAFQFHGKSFHRIRQMLPDKSIAHLVKYYYRYDKMKNLFRYTIGLIRNALWTVVLHTAILII